MMSTNKPPSSTTTSTNGGPPAGTSGSGSRSHHHHHHHHHHHSSSQQKKEGNTPAVTDILNSTPSDYQCKLKFQNTLPDVPFDPKFILVPSEFNKYTQYKTTSLERNYKYPLHTDAQLGIPIDLIDASVYTTPKNKIAVPEEDQDLLIPLSQQQEDQKRATTLKRYRPNAAWLRKTEYLSLLNENTFGRPQRRNSATPSKSINGVSVNEGAIIPIQQQFDDVELVENTFDLIKERTFVHPNNPDLKPVSVMSVLPDFDHWANNYTEVNFDHDPMDPIPSSLADAELDEFVEKQEQARTQGIVKGITDKFVYFITPDIVEDINDNNSKKRLKANADANITEYKMQKVLTSDIFVDKDNENYFLFVKNNTVYYNRLKTKVNLKRIKSRDDKILVEERIGKPESITYQVRELNDQEKEEKQSILSKLLCEERAPFFTQQ
ncbi:hypothetical protein CYY_004190 [Polysphondylium violaceum]|uniref:RNA polymerase II-associated factor 1 n=1 Tax=Polysphondylium violaceum TaxID=133409 RepID=A0A8J4PVM3_9MYCE|nr:hypothetical protein CYY_004190 [Polysphondylium violaceum]